MRSIELGQHRRSLGLHLATPPFELSDDRLVVGFHGRLRPWHGFERLVDVLVEARRRELSLLLVCVGDGPYASRWEAESIAWREAVPDAYVKAGC